MNILLITELYPAYKNQPKADMTYAIHYFAREWIKQGHRVIVLNSHMCHPRIFNFIRNVKNRNKYRNEFEYELDGVIIKRVPVILYPKIKVKSKIHMYFTISKLKEYLESKKFNPDVILCHMINPALVLGKDVKKINNAPLMMTFHISDILRLEEKEFYNQFKNLYKSVDAYGFRTIGIAKSFKSKYSEFMDNKRSFIVNSGIESNQITSVDLLKANDTKILKVLTVSSLIQRKNVDIIIRAISALSKEYNIELNIIGDGPKRDELNDLIISLDMANKIRIFSELDRYEVFKYMEQSDIFALVSKDETLGLVYLEAMAKGCITIGSRNEGIDGIIIDEENGFLCEAGNMNELVEILKNIIKCDKNKLYNIKLNAVNTMKNLTQDKVAKDYINFIENNLLG